MAGVAVHDCGTAEIPMLLRNSSAAMFCKTFSRVWRKGSSSSAFDSGNIS